MPLGGRRLEDEWHRSGTPSRHGAVSGQQGSTTRGKGGIGGCLRAARRYGESIITCLPPIESAVFVSSVPKVPTVSIGILANSRLPLGLGN